MSRLLLVLPPLAAAAAADAPPSSPDMVGVTKLRFATADAAAEWLRKPLPVRRTQLRSTVVVNGRRMVRGAATTANKKAKTEIRYKIRKIGEESNR